MTQMMIHNMLRKILHVTFSCEILFKLKFSSNQYFHLLLVMEDELSNSTKNGILYLEDEMDKVCIPR